MFYVVLLYALFASVFTISKHALQNAAPAFLVGFRMILAGLSLIGFLFFYKKKDLFFTKKDILFFVALGIFNIYLTNVLEFIGLKHLTSFKTCFIYSLSPFVSALLSYLFLSEVMTKKKWIGLLIGVLGLIPVLFSEGAEEKESAHFFLFSWAELSVMGAAVATVYGWILMRQIVTDRGYSPLTANAYSMLIGGVFSLVHSYFFEPWNPLPIYNSYLDFFLSSLALMLVSNLICYNLYGYLLKKYSAPFMSFAGYTTPFFTAFFGWFFLRETVPYPFFVSGFVVLIGLFLFYQEELRLGVARMPAIQKVRIDK